MDTVTQVVLGAAVGKAGWGKRFGSRALKWGAICGIIPDLDVVSRAFGPWSFLEYHRGVSHSLVFSLGLSLVMGPILWRLYRRKEPLSNWITLIFFCTVTHPLLDIFTSYGTVFFWPFSAERFALDGVAIIDPIYTLVLAFGLIYPFDRRRSFSLSALRVSRLALFLSTAYLLFGLMANHRVRRVASQSLGKLGVHPVRIRALPLPFSLFYWRVIAQTEEGVLYVSHYRLGRGRIVRWASEKDSVGLEVRAAMGDPRVRLFVWFADRWVSYRKVGNKLIISDQRYGRIVEPFQSFWRVEGIFSGGEVSFYFVRSRLRFDEVIEDLRALSQL